VDSEQQRPIPEASIAAHPSTTERLIFMARRLTRKRRTFTHAPKLKLGLPMMWLNTFSLQALRSTTVRFSETRRFLVRFFWAWIKAPYLSKRLISAPLAGG
jgi:hypothetical protein